MNLKSKSKKAVVIGAGTHGQVYCSYLQHAGIDVIGFVDDSKELYGKKVINLPVLGCYSDLLSNAFKSKVSDVYCFLGNNEIRVKYLSEMKSFGYNIPSFIHSSACVGPDVVTGEAIYMLPGNVIMPHTTIGNYFMMNACSTIAHHAIVEDGVFLSSGVNIGAQINIKKNAYIGMGATAMTGINTIGKNTLIGAGAVVIKDVPNYAVVVGNPARIIRYTNR